MIITNAAKLIKGQPLAKVQPNDNVRDACKVMCDLDVRAVLVLDKMELVGVLSERDVVRKCVCADRHSTETLVSDVMTRDPVTISAGGPLAQALEIMAQGGFHHVPVMNDGHPIGLISSDDVPEESRMMLERFKEMRGG